jgi:acyl carrier protein
MKREQVLKIIIENVKNLVDTYPENQRFNVDENTILFGLKSEIDSLSLVSVIVDLETEFYDSFNIEISLTDDRAMTREISPYDNISVLGDYIVELVAEKL